MTSEEEGGVGAARTPTVARKDIEARLGRPIRTSEELEDVEVTGLALEVRHGLGREESSDEEEEEEEDDAVFIQTAEHVVSEGVMQNLRNEFEELVNGHMGGKFMEVRRTQFSTGGVHDLGHRVYIVPHEHHEKLSTIMSSRDGGASIINSNAIPWFDRLMLDLACNAWDIFLSQFVETVRRDEGQDAAKRMEEVLASLDLNTPERRARALTHQLASLTLLAYTASLSQHRDAPMFGHTIGAITVKGQGQLTLKRLWSPGGKMELSLGEGSFYSFAGPYRDEATHGAAVCRPTPAVVVLPSTEGYKRARTSPFRWTVLVRMWLPGRVRYVRMKADRTQEFVGWRRLGSHPNDTDEDTHGMVFNDLHWAKDDRRWATPDFTSLKEALADMPRA